MCACIPFCLVQFDLGESSAGTAIYFLLGKTLGVLGGCYF